MLIPQKYAERILRERSSQKRRTKMNETKMMNEMSEYGYQTNLVPARDYKSRLFCIIYKDKKEFLELYNAINGTTYDNPDDLIVTTLENAVYLGMKNDVSYLVYDHLSLYEHQSTDNPNMPLRNLLYVSEIYSNLISCENIYGTKLIEIPKPRFIVFYNGMDELPERKILKLSNAYKKEIDSDDNDVPLELITEVININPGHNELLMEKCKSLRDYMIYVMKVRTYSQQMKLTDAVEKAIDECIEENVLADLLRRNRAEVYKACLYEYNEERQRMMDCRDAREDGKIEGKYLMLIGVVRKKAQKGMKSGQIAEWLEEGEDIINKIMTLISSHPEFSDEELVEKLML